MKNEVLLAPMKFGRPKTSLSEADKSLILHGRDAHRYHFCFSGMSLCPVLQAHVGFKLNTPQLATWKLLPVCRSSFSREQIYIIYLHLLDL